MLKLLLKKQLAEIFRKYNYNMKTGKARSASARALMILGFAFLMVGVMGGLCAFFAYGIGSMIIPAGLGWLYFALFGFIAVFLGSFGSVFNTYASLYLPKDNDLLLSMPIPVRSIIAARLTSVYLMGLMYSWVVMLPAVIVYWCLAPVTVMTIVGGLLMLVLISIFVLTLSCFFGWVVARLSLKMKNKGLLSAIVGMLFLGLYYGLSSRLTDGINSFVENASAIGEAVKGAAYPVYIFGQAGVGDPLPLLIVTAVILVLFALTYLLVSHSFLKIATAASTNASASGKKVELRQKGLSVSLLSNELSHFFSNSSYIMNCGPGIFFLPIAGIALLIKGSDLLNMMSFIPELAGDLVPAVLCATLMLIISMNDVAEPSVSLDAKQLWLLQSLPIRPIQILGAKMAAHWVVTGLPALFCSICIFFVTKLSAVQMIYVLLLPQLFVVLCAAFDLLLGLRMPILQWTSESTPIKQGAGVIVAILAAILYVAAMVGLYLLVCNMMTVDAYMLCVTAFTLVLDIVLLQWHRTVGSRCFAELH